ncbi:putative NAD(P)-binding domain superfamily [Dioscorea sansibarensis]
MAMPSQTSSSPPIDISSNNAGELNSVCTDVVGEHDLLIVGPGVLGRIVAEKWQQEYPGSQIYGQTMTTNHHDELIRVGIKPFLRDTKFSHKFPYVIFCAPPFPTTDYPNDLRLAASNWSDKGSFLFTSSTAVYDCYDNGLCAEDSPLVPIGRSSRTDVLLKAENAALEAGGPHMYWLEKGTVESRPDHILNLIHYEDAASLSVAILKKNLRNRVFVGCDNHPLSRQDIMDGVSQSGKFDKKFIGFTGTDDPLGKKIYNTKTRTELGWEPKYPSFRQFLGLTV